MSPLPSLRYGDLAPETDADAALRMLDLLFGDKSERVTLWLRSAQRARESLSLFDSVEQIMATIRAHGLGGITYQDPSGERGLQQVYIAPGVVRDDAVIPGRLRARKEHVLHTWVAWIDLDVKIGAFGNRDEVLELVWCVLDVGVGGGVRPQIVVESGSGGLHVYWRLAEPIGPEASEELNARLVAWAKEQSGVSVDSCTAANHLMRLAGTIRWPKGEESDRGIAAAQVRLLRAEDSTTSLDALLRMTESAWQRELVRRERVASAVEESDSSAARALAEGDWNGVVVGVGWSGAQLAYAAREAFNTEISWGEVLEPLGWTRSGQPARDGTQEWTRPHDPREVRTVNPRSATTDWDTAPHVMSLLSESEATGLSHLKGTRVRLDKARVAAELWHGGDMAALLTAFLDTKKRVMTS